MTRQVASTTALVLGFLMVMMLGGRLIRYFGIAAEGNLDISLLFTIIGYNLPYFLELILPLAFFIALMLVFGRLYVDQEMAVINASGISRGKLARMMTPLILALFVGEAALSVVGKPWGVRSSETIWQEQALTSAFDLIRPNEFITNGNYHLYVGSLSDNKKQLQDVILIQTEPTDQGSAIRNTDTKNTDPDPTDQLSIPDLPKALTDTIDSSNQSINKDIITLAKRAEQVDNGGSGVTQLDLFQGRRYEVGAGSLKYNQVSFDRYRITLTESSKEVVTEDNIETQAIGPLWQAATGSAQIGSDNAMRAAKAELGYRLALPWLMIIAPMLAVPLAQVRPRQGRWLRLFPSVLLFVSCAMGVISLKNAVSKGSVSVWSYAWLILGFMVLALYMNWGNRIQHRLRFRQKDKQPVTDNSFDHSDSNSSDSNNHGNGSQGGQL
nr:LPS export ABC transporter permease LptF [Psychrobacter sp. 72-O-c]